MKKKKQNLITKTNILVNKPAYQDLVSMKTSQEDCKTFFFFCVGHTNARGL